METDFQCVGGSQAQGLCSKEIKELRRLSLLLLLSTSVTPPQQKRRVAVARTSLPSDVTMKMQVSRSFGSTLPHVDSASTSGGQWARGGLLTSVEQHELSWPGAVRLVR